VTLERERSVGGGGEESTEKKPRQVRARVIFVGLSLMRHGGDVSSSLVRRTAAEVGNQIRVPYTRTAVINNDDWRAKT